MYSPLPLSRGAETTGFPNELSYRKTPIWPDSRSPIDTAEEAGLRVVRTFLSAHIDAVAVSACTRQHLIGSTSTDFLATPGVAGRPIRANRMINVNQGTSDAILTA